jgi:hypothetical protein
MDDEAEAVGVLVETQWCIGFRLGTGRPWAGMSKSRVLAPCSHRSTECLDLRMESRQHSLRTDRTCLGYYEAVLEHWTEAAGARIEGSGPDMVGHSCLESTLVRIDSIAGLLLLMLGEASCMMIDHRGTAKNVSIVFDQQEDDEEGHTEFGAYQSAVAMPLLTSPHICSGVTVPDNVA